MKNKILKMALLSAILLSTVLFVNKVDANSCKVYKAYYYFLDVTTRGFYNDQTNINNSGFYDRNTTTYVPAGNAVNAVLKEQGQIKILKDNAASGEWSLEDYYNNYKKR